MEAIISKYFQVTHHMNPTRRAYLELHLAVFLYGFTAILGKLILLDATILVWWRVFITTISLLFIVKVGKLFRELPRQLIFQFFGIGVIVALHWITFFGSIHLANASITLVCMATSSFFTALLEPFIMKQRVKWYQIWLSLIIVPGMVLIVNHTEVSMQTGIWVGLLSSFLASLFSTINKKLIDTTDSLNITFLELGSAWLFLSIVIPFYLYFSETPIRLMPDLSEFSYLMILAIICTVGGYVLALRALKHISAFASNLTVNLEPVYGILLAILILNEDQELTTEFYWGVVIILLAVFCYPFLSRRFEQIKN